MIPITKPSLDNSDYKHIKKVLKSKILTDGYFQQKTEILLKKSINNKYKLGEPRMLLSYERERLVDMNFRVSSVSLLNYFSKTDNPFLRIIRSSSIKYLFNFNPLKSTIMKLGLGSQ